MLRCCFVVAVVKAFLVAEVSIGTVCEMDPKACGERCADALLTHTEVTDIFWLVLGVVQRVVVLPQVLKPFVTRPDWILQWQRPQQNLSLLSSSFLAWRRQVAQVEGGFSYDPDQRWPGACSCVGW